MEMNNNDLDKSFIQQNENSKINLNQFTEQINSKNKEDNDNDIYHFMDSDDEGQFSNLLSSLNNYKQFQNYNVNFSTPTSNELNIFDSCDSKYKGRSHFFRTITKTTCEINQEENKRINDKTINYLKKSNSKTVFKDVISEDCNIVNNIIIDEEEEKLNISPFKASNK